MKHKNTTKGKLLTLSLGTVLAALALGVTVSASQVGAIGDGKFYPGHLTLADTIAAAADLNEELAEEGMVLLKNDGTLPLDQGAWVSVFGAHASGLNGGSTGAVEDAATTIPEGLRRAGFKVNPTLEAYYDLNGAGGSSGPMSSGGNYTEEPTSFSGADTASFRVYKDAAIVVLARTGGEGSDVSTNIGEIASEEEVNSHAALAVAKDRQGNEHTYRHALMLTESEYRLLDIVKANFSKICVVINSSNAMELGGLKDDPAINAMLWMGRPGETGCAAVGRILSGAVNPSGRLVDEFPRDLTADPTWANIGDQSQVGNSNHAYRINGDVYYVNEPLLGASGDATYTSTDYEEGIYLGYRYYETYYEDLWETDPLAAEEWYDSHVAYAFGDGLSYTSFQFDIQGIFKDVEGKPLGNSVEPSLFDSSAGNPAQVKKLYVPVKVTNTGDVAGKETVQIYVKAPYTKGGIEKSVHDIVGFGKTSLLQPGKSEIVTVEFNVQDFASWDADDANSDTVKGDYELDSGTYTVRATSSSHVNLSTPVDEREAYDEQEFALTGNAHLHLDDFTDAELHNLFTTDDGTYEGVGYDGKTVFNSLRTADMMYNNEDGQTQLSRTNFDATFPEPVKNRQAIDENGDPKVDEQGNPVMINGLVFKTEITDKWEAFRTPRVDYYPSAPVDTSTDGIRNYQPLTDNPTDPWYISQAEFDAAAANWTQAASKEGREIAIKFAELRGLDWDDPQYDAFLNQLTWEELTSLFTESRASTPALEAVGKAKSVDEDGPNNYENLFQWVDEPTIAATFNVDLARREGEIVGDMAILTQRTGWYGPGMDMHHSAFSGRNNEYYSQDGLQGGYIGAAVVAGAQSKGVNAMIKHLAFNDQETNRGGQSNMVWTSEQNIRQYEIKMFQMAIQEGGALAGMSGYGRICGVVNQSNYRLNHNLLQDEWGWHGFMITDGYLGMRWCTTIDIMMRAGFGIVYKTEPWYDIVSGRWNAELRGGKGGVEVPTAYGENPEYDAEKNNESAGVSSKVPTAWGENYHQYYYARLNAKSVIYSTVNSNNWENGFTELKLPQVQLEAAKMGVSYSADLGFDQMALGGSHVEYTATGLPEGLSLNSSTGKLSGAAKEMGRFEFEVEAVIDYCIVKSARYTIVVESPLYWVADGDDVADLQVGEEMIAKLTSDVYTTEGEKYNEVSYSATGLPAGISLAEDGTFSGTPTEAGVFDVTVTVKTVKITQSSGKGKNPGEEKREENFYNFNYTFVVKGESGPVVPEKTVEEEIEELQATIAALEAAIADLQAQVNGLPTGSTIETITAEISALKDRIAALEAAGGQQQQGVDSEEIAAIKQSIAALEARVAALEAAAKQASENKESETAKSGCGGSIAAASVTVMALAGAAGLLILKKKKEN